LVCKDWQKLQNNQHNSSATGEIIMIYTKIIINYKSNKGVCENAAFVVVGAIELF
jgi:hypothetical protein